MNFSNLWKGLAVVAVLFLISMEASAQLPVRTQVVQWLNPNGGQVNFNLDGDADGPGPGAAAATTTYTVTWPTNPPNQPAGPASGDQAVLLGTWTGVNDVNLEWYEIDGFVDGSGAANRVTWWLDANTITYTDNFQWDGVGLLTVGDVSVNATGVVTVGGGTGNSTGSVVISEGGAGGNTVTIATGAQTNNWSLNFDTPTAAGPFYVTPSTNTAGAATLGYYYVSNGDGTGSWAVNPAAYIQSGRTPMGGGYSQVISFPTDYSTFPGGIAAGDITVVVTTDALAADANILQVTSITTGGFTVLSSAPLANGNINWHANVVTP